MNKIGEGNIDYLLNYALKYCTYDKPQLQLWYFGENNVFLVLTIPAGTFKENYTIKSLTISFQDINILIKFNHSILIPFWKHCRTGFIINTTKLSNLTKSTIYTCSTTIFTCSHWFAFDQLLADYISCTVYNVLGLIELPLTVREHYKILEVTPEATFTVNLTSKPNNNTYYYVIRLSKPYKIIDIDNKVITYVFYRELIERIYCNAYFEEIRGLGFRGIFHICPTWFYGLQPQEAVFAREIINSTGVMIWRDQGVFTGYGHMLHVLMTFSNDYDGVMYLLRNSRGWFYQNVTVKICIIGLPMPAAVLTAESVHGKELRVPVAVFLTGEGIEDYLMKVTEQTIPLKSSH